MLLEALCACRQRDRPRQARRAGLAGRVVANLYHAATFNGGCMARGTDASVRLNWFERFFVWMERLPGPAILYYALVYVVIVMGYHALLWATGYLPLWQFSADVVVSFPFWAVVQVASFHIFRIQAGVALDAFLPTLELDPEHAARVRLDFVRFDRRTTWVLTLVALAFSVAYLLSPAIPPVFRVNLGTTVLTAGLLLLSAPWFGFFYFIVRSLVNINRLYALVPKVRLFDQQPLYALSRYTSRVGILFIVYLVLTLTTSQVWGESAAVVTGFYLVFNGSIAILVFVVPLLGVHARLSRARQTALADNNRLIDEHYTKIVADIREGRVDRLADLRAANAALLEYRQELTKISTWPWDTVTLRSFVTTLTVPMTVWIVQQVLLRTVVK